MVLDMTNSYEATGLGVTEKLSPKPTDTIRNKDEDYTKTHTAKHRDTEIPTQIESSKNEEKSGSKTLSLTKFLKKSSSRSNKRGDSRSVATTPIPSSSKASTEKYRNSDQLSVKSSGMRSKGSIKSISFAKVVEAKENNPTTEEDFDTSAKKEVDEDESCNKSVKSIASSKSGKKSTTSAKSMTSMKSKKSTSSYRSSKSNKSRNSVEGGGGSQAVSISSNAKKGILVNRSDIDWNKLAMEAVALIDATSSIEESKDLVTVAIIHAVAKKSSTETFEDGDKTVSYEEELSEAAAIATTMILNATMNNDMYTNSKKLASVAATAILQAGTQMKQCILRSDESNNDNTSSSSKVANNLSSHLEKLDNQAAALHGEDIPIIVEDVVSKQSSRQSSKQGSRYSTKQRSVRNEEEVRSVKEVEEVVVEGRDDTNSITQTKVENVVEETRGDEEKSKKKVVEKNMSKFLERTTSRERSSSHKKKSDSKSVRTSYQQRSLREYKDDTRTL